MDKTKYVKFFFKTFFTKRNLAILTILFLIFSYLLFSGIIDNNALVNDSKSFQNCERFLYKMTSKNVDFNSVYGFRIMHLPASISPIFSSSGIFSKLDSRINAFSTMAIDIPFKGNIVFEESRKFLNPASYLLIIVSILAMIYGYDLFRRRDYLDIYRDALSMKSYLGLIIAGFLPIAVSILFIFTFSIVVLLIFGNIAGDTLTLFVPLYQLLILALLFFLIGASLSAIKTKYWVWIAALAIWTFSLIVAPHIVDILTSSEAQMKSMLRIELEKLALLNKFQERAFNEKGEYTSEKAKTEEGKKLLDSFWENEFKDIRAIEQAYINETRQVIEKNNFYSILFPTTFYYSTNNALSSQGYLGYLDFYTYTEQVNADFMKFLLDMRSSGKKTAESFIKGDENIYRARPRFPYYFIYGVIITLTWTLALFFFSFKIQLHRFKKPTMIPPDIKLSEDVNPEFIYCPMEDIKDEAVIFFKSMPNVSCIDKVDPGDFFFYGIDSDYLFDHLCNISNVNPGEAREKLELMLKPFKDEGISFDFKDDNDELLLKMYAAIQASQAHHNTLVLNDFLKGKSLYFEIKFKRLLLDQVKKGKKVVYISTDFFKVRDNLEDNHIKDVYYLTHLPLNDCYLR